MERFWVYLDNKVQGPVEIPALRKLSGFNLLTQVCLEGQESWRMADDVIDIKAYFSAPPRGSSLVVEEQPDLPGGGKSADRDFPPAVSTAVMDAAEPPAVVGNLAMKPMSAGEPVPVPAAGAPESRESLRVSCQVCGYKNPRDVNVCMKCGTPIKTEASKSGCDGHGTALERRADCSAGSRVRVPSKPPPRRWRPPRNRCARRWKSLWRGS